MATAHFGCKMECLRSDNGGEYTSKKMKDFCAECGIILETTAPYTPQTNGVSERMNRTLCQKASSMLLEANLPKHSSYMLWWPDLRKVISSRDVVANEPKKVMLYDEEAEDRGPKKVILYDEEAEDQDEEPRIEADSDESESGGMTESTIKPSDVFASTPIASKVDDTSQSVYMPPAQQSSGRPKRNIKLPERLGGYKLFMAAALSAALVDDDAPVNLKGIEGRADLAEWRSAFNDELQALNWNGT